MNAGIDRARRVSAILSAVQAVRPVTAGAPSEQYGFAGLASHRFAGTRANGR
jgi:hypothetical protein